MQGRQDSWMANSEFHLRCAVAEGGYTVNIARRERRRR
jgi:hypothetical protein